MRRALPLLLVTPAFGFECEYFDPVVVPAVDNYSPILATRAWINGDEQLSLGPIEEVLDASGSDIVIAPGMWDSGGAQRFTLQQAVSVYCHDDSANPPLGQVIFVDYVPQVVTQSGGVGSTVSNGLFILGDVTDMSSLDLYCSADFELREVTYTWAMAGRDFAGHESSMYGGTIVYEP